MQPRQPAMQGHARQAHPWGAAPSSDSISSTAPPGPAGDARQSLPMRKGQRGNNAGESQSRQRQPYLPQQQQQHQYYAPQPEVGYQHSAQPQSQATLPMQWATPEPMAAYAPYTEEGVSPEHSAQGDLGLGADMSPMVAPESSLGVSPSGPSPTRSPVYFDSTAANGRRVVVSEGGGALCHMHFPAVRSIVGMIGTTEQVERREMERAGGPAAAVSAAEEFKPVTGQLVPQAADSAAQDGPSHQQRLSQALTALADLHARGALSEEEYSLAKWRVINGESDFPTTVDSEGNVLYADDAFFEHAALGDILDNASSRPTQSRNISPSPPAEYDRYAPRSPGRQDSRGSGAFAMPSYEDELRQQESKVLALVDENTGLRALINNQHSTAPSRSSAAESSPAAGSRRRPTSRSRESTLRRTSPATSGSPAPAPGLDEQTRGRIKQQLEASRERAAQAPQQGEAQQQQQQQPHSSPAQSDSSWQARGSRPSLRRSSLTRRGAGVGGAAHHQGSQQPPSQGKGVEGRSQWEQQPQAVGPSSGPPAAAQTAPLSGRRPAVGAPPPAAGVSTPPRQPGGLQRRDNVSLRHQAKAKLERKGSGKENTSTYELSPGAPGTARRHDEPKKGTEAASPAESRDAWGLGTAQSPPLHGSDSQAQPENRDSLASWASRRTEQQAPAPQGGASQPRRSAVDSAPPKAQPAHGLKPAIGGLRRGPPSMRHGGGTDATSRAQQAAAHESANPRTNVEGSAAPAVPPRRAESARSTDANHSKPPTGRDSGHSVRSSSPLDRLLAQIDEPQMENSSSFRSSPKRTLRQSSPTRESDSIAGEWSLHAFNSPLR